MEHMSVTNITLVAGCFSYTVCFGAGLYETLTVMPQWFTDPPRSFQKINERSKQVQAFWIPAQIATFFLLALAVIAKIHEPSELYLAVAGLCYLAALVSTTAYFLKRIKLFMAAADSTTISPRLRAQSLRWYQLSLLRTLALAVGSIAYILAVLAA